MALLAGSTGGIADKSYMNVGPELFNINKYT
jgi:hypothetical protein